ncbi:pyridoxal-phosphate dependent enzyme [Galactobacter caseinivorans]|uniref:Pyridoxal-phosphate dependent enzyme n=1 Tax=Galactobacter caseinivorans TaxID=2676123 RepID=A0A496PN34_9MICC|nr:pyridoxal-phosphate dependent enzyme [Galactobacter caseinivorans]RKW71950.1 pyridoxal-phosphate dependent enzyme [Galactobacter caseinivorans]
MRYAETVLDLIGKTPLVRLHSVTKGIGATVLAKVEYLNPGGSIKDRISLEMIERAEAAGLLRPGGTIVEPTSGNTGVGLAMVGALKGYPTVFVTPDKVGEEKRAVLRAYGAEVVVTASSVAPDSPDSYYGVSDALVQRTPGAYKPDQFSNPAAPDSHYATTGPEIWADTDGLLTHVVIGAGTGGTITGTGRYLKEVSADRATGPVTVVAADPAGSVYSGGTGRPYYTEGVGEDMWPGNYDPAVPDRLEAVTDAESFEMTRRLAREEGLLVGGSSGMAVVAALRVAKDLPDDAVVVVILPDSGRGYIGKIFDDAWMRSHGFETRVPPKGSGEHPLPDAAGTVGGALTGSRRQARKGLPATVDVAAALVSLEAAKVPALPVLSSDTWPAREGEVRGSVSVQGLRTALAAGTALGETALSRVLEPALPTVGAGEGLTALIAAWAGAGAVPVLRGGELVDVVTPTDLSLG